MSNLSDSFVSVIDELDLPTPDLAPAVLDQISELPHLRRGHRLVTALRSGGDAANRSRFGIGFAVATFVVAALSIAIAPSRSAIADWLGIGSTGIERVPTTEPAPPSVGTSTTLAAAAGSLGEPIEVPPVASPIASLGQPDEVFEAGPSESRGRSYSWAPSSSFPELGTSGRGVVLSVRTTSGELDWKAIGVDASVEFVRVEFQGSETSGLWIPASHQLLRAGTDQPVLAESVLLWVDPESVIQYRLETNAGLQKNLMLAAQVDGGEALLREP